MSEGAVMRLGHFPTPHPDELLYSLCARFSARVRYSSSKSVIENLVGTTDAAATVDLPNNLGQLVSALPAGSPLTAERLIKRHTLLPFFSAFLPPERVTQLESDMRGGCGQAGYMRSGVMASRIPTPRYLRLCPICFQEDVRRFREAYWHRTHQMPGVEVCPTHGVFLEESNVSRGAGRKNLQFITADKAARATPPRRINYSDSGHQALLQIARDAAWLLKHLGTGSELSALRNRYLNLLVDRGLATYTGSIHVRALIGEFTRHYSADLLQLLHCEFTGSDHTKTNWLLRLVRPPKHAQHPLYHLLLMQFLGCTAADFFATPEQLSIFGEGPWPCLNPAAAHFKSLVIRKYTLSTRLRNNRPIGRFSCECGFTYARSGPDHSPEDRYRIGKMISFGPVWGAKLKRLWKETALSLSEVGRRLGVDPLTVRRHAARLKLPLSHHGTRSKPLKRLSRLRGGSTLADWRKKRRACRSKWLSARKQNPRITVKDLRHWLPHEYAWLLQHDSEWLGRHRPRPQKRKQSTTGVDWKRRDSRYAAAVRAAASRLKAGPSRPVHVTRTAIGRTVGAISLLQHKLAKMPLAAQVLADVVETREQYGVRRVWWAAARYLQEGIQPRAWQLISRANVYSLRENPAIQCAIEGAIQATESKLSHVLKISP